MDNINERSKKEYQNYTVTTKFSKKIRIHYTRKGAIETFYIALEAVKRNSSFSMAKRKNLSGNRETSLFSDQIRTHTTAKKGREL